MQPFIALGKRMRDEHAPRAHSDACRICRLGAPTRPRLLSGAGDPKALMAMQVNNEFVLRVYQGRAHHEGTDPCPPTPAGMRDRCNLQRVAPIARARRGRDDVRTQPTRSWQPPAMSQLHIASAWAFRATTCSRCPGSTAHSNRHFGRVAAWSVAGKPSTYSADMAIWYGTRDLSTTGAYVRLA